jgi:crotonobetainyl-CoA:carnitine CoA-transferase CaiB-like acyl-CoA transferase
MSVTGEPDRPPQKVGVPIIDAAAAHLGAQAVLAALFGRERSGAGQSIELSLLEVALHLQASTWSDYLGGAPEPTRIGGGQPHNAPAAEVVPTRDGYIVVSAYAEEHWARFCRVIGREELVTDERFCSNARRVANRTALRQVLQECLSQSSSADCVERLTRSGIVAGAVRSYRQVLESPDVLASGVLVEAAASDGSAYRVVGRPYRFGPGRRPTPAAAPAVGAHGDELLAEAGYTPEDIHALRLAGALA